MAFVKSLEKAISQLGPLLQGLRMVLEHRRDVTSKSFSVIHYALQYKQ